MLLWFASLYRVQRHSNLYLWRADQAGVQQSLCVCAYKRSVCEHPRIRRGSEFVHLPDVSNIFHHEIRTQFHPIPARMAVAGYVFFALKFRCSALGETIPNGVRRFIVDAKESCKVMSSIAIAQQKTAVLDSVKRSWGSASHEMRGQNSRHCPLPFS